MLSGLLEGNPRLLEIPLQLPTPLLSKTQGLLNASDLSSHRIKILLRAGERVAGTHLFRPRRLDTGDGVCNIRFCRFSLDVQRCQFARHFTAIGVEVTPLDAIEFALDNALLGL